jgi:RES domain-containing protein
LSHHPDPPSSFRVLITLVSSAWSRIHAVKHDPLYFGREPRNRFDAPAKEFGVLYVAKDFHGAFIETFGHSTGVRFVTTAELRVRGLAVITPQRKLRLVDLRGEGLARMGADAELTSGPDYDLARRWARAIHDHPRKPDGILYRARHDPSRTCAAIFERTAPELGENRLGTFHHKVNRRLLADILDTYKFGLVS